MAVGRRRAIDTFRHQERWDRKRAEIGHEEQQRAAGEDPALAAVVEDDIEDDLLRLVFTACHPVLSTEARVALALRVLCELRAEAMRLGRVLAGLMPQEPEVHGSSP